jgi:hypothetical protein
MKEWHLTWQKLIGTNISLIILGFIRQRHFIYVDIKYGDSSYDVTNWDVYHISIDDKSQTEKMKIYFWKTLILGICL